MTPNHEAALAYAARGIPVFPCRVGGKKPLAGSHSYQDATTDPDKINAWWADTDYNIGFEPGSVGWTVVDVDDKNGHRGSRSWSELCPEPPETLMVRTPSGGFHIYFLGTVRPSAGVLADGLDIRSQDSYVLLPPSVVDGKAYEIIHAHPLAPLPTIIVERCKTKKAVPVAAPEGVEEDPEGSEAWAIDLIERTIEHDGPAIVGTALNEYSSCPASTREKFNRSLMMPRSRCWLRRMRSMCSCC